MIEVKGISKQYGNKVAISDVSFTVENGQILGLLGRNGAGKSTTMNIITGYISCDSGEVKIDGYDILKQPEQAKSRLGYLPEIPPVYPEMTVTEYLKFACKLMRVPKKEIDSQVEEILKMVGIDNVAQRLIGNLSKGYRQRVGLAKALCGNPDTIILDEPTVGLDPKQIVEIRQTIKELGKTHTIVISSHLLSEIADICTHVVIIHNGRVVANDSLSSIVKDTSETDLITLEVRGEADESFFNMLSEIKGVKDVNVKYKDGLKARVELEAAGGEDITEAVFDAAVKKGLKLTELRSDDLTLEDVFIKLTEEKEEREIQLAKTHGKQRESEA